MSLCVLNWGRWWGQYVLCDLEQGVWEWGRALLALDPWILWALFNSSICVFSLFCPVLCPFVGVICVIRLPSLVTSLIAHPLSFSFEGEDKVVMVSPLVWLATWLAPPAAIGGELALPQSSVCWWLRSGLDIWEGLGLLVFFFLYILASQLHAILPCWWWLS